MVAMTDDCTKVGKNRTSNPDGLMAAKLKRLLAVFQEIDDCEQLRCAALVGAATFPETSFFQMNRAKQDLILLESCSSNQTGSETASKATPKTAAKTLPTLETSREKVVQREM
jgi:hypothetical protein